MSKRTWISLAAVAVFLAVALGVAGLAIPMGMGTMGSGRMHGGRGMGPGMMGGGMGPGGMGTPGWYGNEAPNQDPAVRDRTGNPVPDSAESIERGHAAFRTRCVACHGEEGRGDGLAAASLGRRPANLQALAGHRTDHQLYTALTYGLGAMPAFGGSLTERERWDVVNFVQNLGEGQPQR